MKIYRLSCRNEDGHQGYAFFSSKAAAEFAAKEDRARNEPDDAQREEYEQLGGGNCPPTNESSQDIDVLEIEPTKAGILQALNYYASHNNNG